MPNVTYFVQDCPTCGRKLNVRVEYLGKSVVCQHCRGAFVAWDPEGAPSESDSSVKIAGETISLNGSSLSGTRLLDRAQELIEMADQKIAESRIIRAKMDRESTLNPAR